MKLMILTEVIKCLQDIKSELETINRELVEIKNELLIQKNTSMENMPKQSSQINSSDNNEIPQDIISHLKANLPKDRELIFAKQIKLQPGENTMHLDIHSCN